MLRSMVFLFAVCVQVHLWFLRQAFNVVELETVLETGFETVFCAAVLKFILWLSQPKSSVAFKPFKPLSHNHLSLFT